MRTALITAHAATATVALLATLGGRRARWFAVHYGALVAMLLLLVAAVAVDLPGRAPAELVIDAALVCLGLVMVAHTEGARRVRRHDRSRFVERLGFSMVGLVDAFVVVAVFNVAPAWVAATLGVTIAAAGHLAIRAAQLTARSPAGAGGPSPTRSSNGAHDQFRADCSPRRGRR